MNSSDPKYTPTFRKWLHDLQVVLGSEVEIESAWEVYDDGASVEEAVKIFQDEY